MILHFCIHAHSYASAVLHPRNPTKRSFVRVQALPPLSVQQSTAVPAIGGLTTVLAMPPLYLVSPSLRVQRRRERERVRGRRERERESCLITLLSLTVHRLGLLTPWESQCWNRYAYTRKYEVQEYWFTNVIIILLFRVSLYIIMLKVRITGLLIFL